MTSTDRGNLIRLKDTDETIDTADQDIRGRHVLDKHGKDLGKIDALFIDDAEQRVRFLEVATGGFLGIGKDKSLIPVDTITHVDPERVHLNQTSDTVAGAPTYDPGLMEKPSEFYENTYGYYGVLPFWGIGYAYPSYSRTSGEDPRRA
ncbi:hypothetical protein AX769_21390 (plasmid) [Frondihabitans sp. PAMC 28766]|uniref:PRC-barrel domain-containing protein n=1 Tax=Frondihabitans sp. PAMC 28766 TaxID=1795630 RepID=UPI00078EF6E2|nr:PRC-barrel domain-containing protein [Frondihabitans sp. PAMC 28766]AMM22682.1 hypothetical protein AX769_21390 [Frondihabitans sp. PAMC 28766]